MTGRLHVIGAGLAGLAAALAAARAGREVRLHEAAPQAGGRCRAVDAGEGAIHDNGTHVLLGCNRQALAFLDRIGAVDLWVEPEPDGLPVLDLAGGRLHRIALSPWRWRDPALRPPGLGTADLLGLARLLLPGRDRPVAGLMGRGSLARMVVEPLTVAALNTPVAEASSRRLAHVLRRIGLPGAGRLLVARRGLGPDLIGPALATLAGLGVAPRFNHRLRALRVERGRVAGLAFTGREVALGPGDEVALALPPHGAARLLPGLAVSQRHEPIVNLHFSIPPCSGRVRFVGLLGGLAQWVLFRCGMASVTISAAREAMALPGDVLTVRVWDEVREAGGRIGRALPDEPPPCRIVKERRATLSQVPGIRIPLRRPLANLILAGDWLSPLPATIEAAIASGLAAGGGWQPRRHRLLSLPARTRSAS